MAVTILLADDHAVIRDGLRYFLEAQDNLEVVGDAGDGYEVVDQAQRFHPDIILMAIDMPGQNGIDATRVIHQNCPQTQVVILSMHSTLDYVHEALSAGAQGYLSKEVNGKEVISAIVSVMAGKRYLCSRVTEMITEAFLDSYHQSPAIDITGMLSQREREVLALVISGHSSKEIAEMLFLSPNTVDTYRSRIMHKLGVTDLSALLRKCIELDIKPAA